MIEEMKIPNPVQNCWYTLLMEIEKCSLEGIVLSLEGQKFNEDIEIRLIADGQQFIREGFTLDTEHNFIGTLTPGIIYGIKTLLFPIPKDIDPFDALRVIRIVTHDTTKIHGLSLMVDVRKLTINGTGKLIGKAFYRKLK